MFSVCYCAAYDLLFTGEQVDLSEVSIHVVGALLKVGYKGWTGWLEGGGGTLRLHVAGTNNLILL